MSLGITIGLVLLILVGLALFSLRFRPDKYINSRGYVVLSKSNELEHREIAKQLLGRDLEQNEIVHHINGKKTDNQIRNLCLMDSEKHEHFHSWLMWKKKKNGRYPSFKNQKRVLEQEYGGTGSLPGNYNKLTKTVEVVMPNGRVLRGKYSVYNPSFNTFGSVAGVAVAANNRRQYAAAVSVSESEYTTHSDSGSAYAILRGGNIVMEILVQFTGDQGYGDAVISTGERFRIQF